MSCVVHSDVPHVPPASPGSPELSSLPFPELLLPGVKEDNVSCPSRGAWLPLAALLCTPASLWWETKLLQSHPKARSLG